MNQAARAPIANPRVLAVQALTAVRAGHSLSAVLPPLLAQAAVSDRGFIQECCYGCLRWYPQLEFILSRLLHKPLAARETELHMLLWLGLYQLLHLRLPAYAAVTETVDAARAIGKQRVTGLLNAILRNCLRRQEALLAEWRQDADRAAAHPDWLLRRIRQDWPEDWEAVVVANNRRPGLGLRVNRLRIERTEYLARLQDADIAARVAAFAHDGIVLASPCNPTLLPGFADGLVSVQDPAAQLAAPLLRPEAGHYVLDACAAPGGKTCHILEYQPQAEVLALDVDSERLRRVADNLQRLQLQARLCSGDATMPETWWDGRPFDRILLDAPCSGLGVIRRHPDIKLLRTVADCNELAARQTLLLNRLWPLLKPGGLLVYATCSILKQENRQPIADFLAAHNDAVTATPVTEWGRSLDYGRQILPGDADVDGFYYCVLQKTG